ncbi:MAG: hypothetical protein ACYC6C_05460 [Coriobacteriia bacterium]
MSTRGTTNALPASVQAWLWPVAAVAVGWLAWMTYTRNGWVPFLSGVDLGIHEFGHLLTMWAPMLVVASAGSVLQVAAPLCFSVYFARRRDLFATALMLGWAAESLNNVSIYIYDAARLALPLWGDTDGSAAGHDWANILTATRLIPQTDAIALTVRGFSVLLFAAALAVIAYGAARPLLRERKDAAVRARQATLPVRTPRNPVPEVTDDTR